MFVCLATLNSWTIWEEVWTNRIPPQPHLLHGRCVRILQNPRLEISWQFTRKLRTHRSFCFCLIKHRWFWNVCENWLFCDDSYQLWQFTDAYSILTTHTGLDVSITCINASRSLSACCPVWKLPEHRNNARLSPWNTPMMVAASSRRNSFKRLCCWVVKLQSVANIEEFPKTCCWFSRNFALLQSLQQSMIFKWSTKTSLNKI